MTTAMRDSSKDYRTYWLQGGQYYSKMSNLGDPTVCELPPAKLSEIPSDDRLILTEEASADPVFCRDVMKLMATDPEWAHKVSASAKEAVINELHPSMGRKAGWPRLRARVRELKSAVAEQATSLASKATPAERFALVKRIASGEFKEPKAVAGLGNLGQWDIIGSIVGSLAQVGGSIYGAKITSDAQQDIAKLQASAAMQSAQAQMAIANANAAIAGAQVQMASPISSLTSSTIAGIPVIIPILGVAAVGLWLAFGRKR